VKKAVTLLVLVGFVGVVAGLALAQDAPKDVTFKGTIVKVEEKTVVLSMEREGRKMEHKFMTDDKTVVTVDAKEAKVADLKAGMMAEVTRPAKDGAAATKIVATTAATSAPVIPVNPK
jgi:hypothetical protein